MTQEVRLVLLDYLSRNYDDLKRRLVRHLRNADLADDALHDTWLRVRQLENGNTVLNPRAFLLRTAVNVAINNIRSQGAAVPRSEIDALLEVADPAPGPEQTAAARADMDALVKILQRMPQRRRDILLLVRWDGLPQKEVAKRLGLSLSTVEHELKRALDFCNDRMAARK